MSFFVYNSPKTQTKTIRLVVVVKSNFFVHFLGELKIPKKHFKINWPLYHWLLFWLDDGIMVLMESYDPNSKPFGKIAFCCYYWCPSFSYSYSIHMFISHIFGHEFLFGWHRAVKEKKKEYFWATYLGGFFYY